MFFCRFLFYYFFGYENSMVTRLRTSIRVIERMITSTICDIEKYTGKREKLRKWAWQGDHNFDLPSIIWTFFFFLNGMWNLDRSKCISFLFLPIGLLKKKTKELFLRWESLCSMRPMNRTKHIQKQITQGSAISLFLGPCKQLVLFLGPHCFLLMRKRGAKCVRLIKAYF